MSNTYQIKTPKTTRDMGLFVPSLVLSKIHEQVTGSAEDSNVTAGEVIIKMSEGLITLKSAISIMEHDLTKLKDRTARITRLHCIQEVTNKVGTIDTLFVRLHAGESPVTIAAEFTELTGVQF